MAVAKVTVEGEKAILRTIPCLRCKEASTLTVAVSEYEAWVGGTLIQRAFPTMPVGEREMLISGIHPKCWDEMFRDEF